MEKLLKNSKEYLALPKDHKRDFLDQLYQFLIDDHATVVDYQKLKSNLQQPFVQTVEVKMLSKLVLEKADKYIDAKIVDTNSVKQHAPLYIACVNIH